MNELPLCSFAAIVFSILLEDNSSWWAGLDSNQRRVTREIYSLLPLPLGDRPIYSALSKYMSNLSFDYLPVCARPGWNPDRLDTS